MRSSAWLGRSSASRSADAAAKSFSRLIDDFKDHPLAAKAQERPGQRALASQRLRGRDRRCKRLPEQATPAPRKPSAADALLHPWSCPGGRKKQRRGDQDIRIDPQGPSAICRQRQGVVRTRLGTQVGGKRCRRGRLLRTARRAASQQPAGRRKQLPCRRASVPSEEGLSRRRPAPTKRRCKTTGKSELGEKAQHKLAWALYQQDDFAAAEKAFAQQLTDYPQGRARRRRHLYERREPVQAGEVRRGPSRRLQGAGDEAVVRRFS